ncbi:MAG TPA: serine/threonine-protein kinase, partial [Gemmataceae bacterium]|nr:serine/threonine-protein kinase [Gemmataceae bacterium]
MPRFLTCPQGHHWEAPAAGPATCCPLCGTVLDPAPVSPGSGADEDSLKTLPPAQPAGPEAPTTIVFPPPGGPAAGAAPAGPMVAGYEILAELGRGGMGVVYKARHTRLNRLVALKMILAGAHAHEEDLARFSAEAEAVAGLRHPHIVQIYDVGEQGGLPYFSLEFVEGGTLEGRLDGTPWLAAPAAGLVETLARAMHAAHERGIV